jgi:hypothetical protein
VIVKPVGAVVALLLGLVGIGAGAPAPATAASPEPEGVVSMTVSPDSLGIPADGGDLHLTVTISNSTGSPVDAGAVDVSVNRVPLGEPAELTGWLDSAADSVTAPTDIARSDTGTIATGETRIVGITLPATTLAFPQEGIYALEVQLDTTAGSDAPAAVADARTAISWKSASASSLHVAVVAPLVVPATTTGFLDADTLAQYTARGGVLSEQLDALAGRAVVIGIDPRILASIRILGSSAPPSALEWLGRLRSAPNETFPLSYADSDLTAELDAGSPGVLAPTSFDFAIDPTRFAAQDTAPTAPTTAPTDPGSDPAKPPVPTMAELTAWDYTYPTLAWPAADSVTTGTFAQLVATGATPTILSSDNVAVAGDTPSVSAVDGHTVVSADSRLSGMLQDVVASSTAAEWNAGMAQLSATVALDSESSGSATPMIVATLGRSWQDTGYRLEQTLDSLYSLPWATSVPLSSILGSIGATNAVPTAGVITDALPDADRTAAVRKLLDAENAEIAFATIVADPLAMTAARRLELLSLLSNAWTDDPAGWAAATDDFLTASADIRDAVQVAPSSTLQLPADRGAIPVTVGNSLSQPVTVYITMRANTLALTVEKTAVKLVIEPQSSRKAQIPVQSQSNGQVQLSVSLTDSKGQPVGTTTFVELNVHAGWETAGTIAFGAFVIIIFGAGIFRTIRKRRRARRSAA